MYWFAHDQTPYQNQETHVQNTRGGEFAKKLQEIQCADFTCSQATGGTYPEAIIATKRNAHNATHRVAQSHIHPSFWEGGQPRKFEFDARVSCRKPATWSAVTISVTTTIYLRPNW